MRSKIALLVLCLIWPASFNSAGGRDFAPRDLGDLTAAAGADQIIQDENGDSWEFVTLDASESSAGAEPIVQWLWSEAGEEIGQEEQVNLSVGLGSHLIELKVLTEAGLSATDEVLIQVQDWLEPNQTVAEAGIADTRHYQNLVLIGDEEDWFRVRRPHPGPLTVQLAFIDGRNDLSLPRALGAANLSLELRGPDDADLILGSSQTSQDIETVSLSQLAAGEVLIRVWNADSQEQAEDYQDWPLRYARYDLWIAHDDPETDPAGCNSGPTPRPGAALLLMAWTFWALCRRARKRTRG